MLWDQASCSKRSVEDTQTSMNVEKKKKLPSRLNKMWILLLDIDADEEWSLLSYELLVAQLRICHFNGPIENCYGFRFKFFMLCWLINFISVFSKKIIYLRNPMLSFCFQFKFIGFFNYTTHHLMPINLSFITFNYLLSF